MNYDHYTDCAVALAVDLVNSFDIVDGEERLADPAALRELLVRNRISFVQDVTEADLDDLRALRGQLREVFTSDDLAAVVALINRLIAESRALPRLTDHDDEPLHLHYERPDGTLAERVAADVAMGLAAVIVGEGLDRFRVCAAENCTAAFVDTSRNRSRRYCDPDTCGNRVHVAAHRARRRAARGG